MSGITSVFAGTVKVPLFDSPNGVEFGYSLDSASYGPLMLNNGQTQSTTPLIGFMDAFLAMVGGNAQFIQGAHNAPGFSTGNAVSYFDGALHYLGQTYPTGTPNYQTGGTWMRKLWKPTPGQVVNGTNYWSQIVDTFPATNKGYGNFQIYPCTWQGHKAEACFYGDGNLNNVGVAVRYNNAFKVGGPFSGDPGPSLWNIPLWLRIGGNTNGGVVAINRMTPGAQGFRSALSGFDNCAVVSPSHTFGAEPGRVAWMNSFDPTGNSSQTVEWHIDNPVLENVWTNVVATIFLKVFPYGFIATIKTSGTGPTGQQYEVMVFNSDCTQYYLIQWVPQDTNSQTQVNSVNACQVAIDEQGIVWFNGQPGAGLQAHISSSFSPTGFFIPVIQAPTLNPFVLPCYNTCSPVPIIPN